VKDEALDLVRAVNDPARKLNLLREYLQALALHVLHREEAFLSLAFVGGTALRFVYGLPRFSEDLDFSLHENTGYGPETWMKALKREFLLGGFDVAVSWNDRTAVHKAWVKVAGVLKEAGLAAMAEQNLSIKIKIDTRPPAGAVCRRTLVTRHRLIAMQHYDLPSLMAGKLHALLTRGYPKGRDWYDLLWSRAQRPPVEPNGVLLQNALDQTQGAGRWNGANWRMDLATRIAELDCRALREDIRSFLEHPSEADLLTADHIRTTLTGS
jgi:predicted nucleotidyltransferase component of viral defense system